jgi:hypothetical protein
MSDKGKLPWRIGANVSQAEQPALCTVYDADGNLIGVMLTRELAALICARVNWEDRFETLQQTEKRMATKLETPWPDAK